MNRQLINAMAAQYATPEVSGDGVVAWESGKKCVIPYVKLYGAAMQETLTGRNLFDANMQYTPSKALNPSTGLPASWGNGWGLSDYIACEPSTTYTRSYDIDAGRVCVAFYDADQSMIGFSTALGVFTTPDDCAYIRMNLIIAKIPACMLVVGEYTAAAMPPYEPYCGGIPAPNPGYPVMPVCNNGVFAARGRNLLKMDYPSRTQNGITFDVLPDGGVKISGTSTASATLTSYKAFGNSELRTLPAGTYNFTGLPYNADLSASIHYYDLDGTFHSVHALSDNGVTIVLSGPVTYYAQVSILGSGKTVDAMIYLQLVRDDAVHVYTPYYDGGQAQVPELWAIPGTDYRDEWDPQMGRGVRRVAENTLDGITEGKKFVAVHNVTPADVFVVQQKEMYPPPGLSGMNDDPNMLSNYFGYGTGYYTNSVGAFKQTVATWGIVCRLPYSMFGIEKGEKTNDELLALANNWLAEKAAEGTPLTWWYALGTPQPFYSPPARLTQPTGYGQIIQISGDIPDCPIAARYLKHS